MNPKITVITISYNNKEGLEKTLKSVTSQNCTDYEYIVIDGGSNDGSKELLESFSNKISYWVSEPDKGIYNAMNKGIAEAKGEYLIFINSGDHFYNKQSLHSSLQYLSGEDIIYGSIEVVDGEHTFIKNYSNKLSLFYFYYESLPHPASFIRRESFKKWGTYDENLKIVSDWKWFLVSICSHNASFKRIDEIVSTFYLDGISASVENQKKISAERNITFLNHFPLVKDDLQQMLILQKENKELQKAESNFNHLKKYRIVKLLHFLGLINIRK